MVLTMNLIDRKEGTRDHGNLKEIDKLIDSVSNVFSKSDYSKQKNTCNSNKFGNELINSNFNESPLDIAKVWKKDKINMKDTISSLMQNLSGSAESKEAIDQIKILDSKSKTKGKINELLPPNKHHLLERKTQYELTQKEMKHWGFTIDRINRQEIISFGKPEKVDIVSTAQLATSYQPLDEFEHEFDNILREINNDCSKGISTLNQYEISPCDQVKNQSEKSFMKKLKFILFQQQKENKRLKKIKSKTWRKNRRRQMQIEEEKLLSLGETEYPELVKKIKEKYEEKRAKIRLMRRQNARQKWAKMALRFGGSELQKNVSDQAQKQYEEKKRIERIIQNVSKDLDVGESSESDQEIESNSNLIKTSRRNINDLKNSSKGLFDLKFIQRGIESENDILDFELNQLEHENSQDITFIKDSDNCLSNNNSDQITHLSKPSEHEILEMKNLIQSGLHSKDDIGINLVENSLNNEIPSYTNDSKYEQEQINEKCVDLQKSHCKKREKLCLNIEDELERMAEIDAMANQGFVNANDELLKHIFVEGSDNSLESDIINKDSNQRNESLNKRLIPGWGNWCSSVSNKEIKIGVNDKSSEKHLINSNKSIDKKITKYCVNQIPHPYGSHEQYESTLKHPIGPEWNTTAIHNKLIQPKIQTRIGAVIKPLIYSKHLKNIQISDSFLEKWNRAKKCNRTKARF